MTGVLPAEMLMDRCSLSHLDLMPSNMSSNICRQNVLSYSLIVSLLFVALLNSMPLLNFEFFNHFSYDLYKHINGS